MTDFFQHSTAIIDEGALIGEGSKIWHFSHIMANASIGKNCNIGQNVFIAPNVKIGDNTKIQNNVSLYTGVECEKDVFLGPCCVFTNVINPRSFIERKSEYRKTLIKQGATIGANATIVCGHTIGKFALIGAGCVIREDVEDYACMVGNPSKKIGFVGEFGHRLEFNEEGIAIEKESNYQYRLTSKGVERIL